MPDNGRQPPAKLLTIDDLAERWVCNARTAMERVKEKGVPFLWLGKGDYDPTKAGTKLMRFRPQSIEAWEARQEKAHRVSTQETAAHPMKTAPQGMPSWWDGKVRTKMTRRPSEVAKEEKPAQQGEEPAAAVEPPPSGQKLNPAHYGMPSWWDGKIRGPKGRSPAKLKAAKPEKAAQQAEVPPPSTQPQEPNPASPGIPRWWDGRVQTRVDPSTK